MPIVGTPNLAPPVGWENFTLLDVSAGGVFTLDNNTDYRIHVGGTAKPFRIRGGRKRVIMSGKVTAGTDLPWYGSEADTTGVEIQDYPFDGSTTSPDAEAYVEGLLVTGEHLTQGFRLNAQKSVVKIVNTHVGMVKFAHCDHRDGRPDLGISKNHPDILQSYNGAFKELHIDGLTGSSGYQGLFLRIGDTAEFSHLEGTGRPVTIRRMNVAGKEFLAEDGYSYAGHRMVWNYGNAGDASFPVTIEPETVWVDGHERNGWQPGGFYRVRYYQESNFTPVVPVTYPAHWDDFEANLSKWTGVDDAAIVNGQLVLTVGASSSASVTSPVEDYTGKGFTVELVNVNANGVANVQFNIALRQDGSNFIEFLVYNDELRVRKNYGTVATVPLDLGGAHKYLSIEDENGDMVLRTSADFETWTVVHTVLAHGLNLTAGTVRLYAYDGTGTSTVTKTMTLDNVNVAPPAGTGSYVEEPVPSNGLDIHAICQGASGFPDTSGTDAVGPWAAYSTGMTDKIYLGAPPGGDYVTSDAVGATYVREEPATTRFEVLVNGIFYPATVQGVMIDGVLRPVVRWERYVPVITDLSLTTEAGDTLTTEAGDPITTEG